MSDTFTFPRDCGFTANELETLRRDPLHLKLHYPGTWKNIITAAEGIERNPSFLYLRMAGLSKAQTREALHTAGFGPRAAVLRADQVKSLWEVYMRFDKLVDQGEVGANCRRAYEAAQLLAAHLDCTAPEAAPEPDKGKVEKEATSDPEPVTHNRHEYDRPIYLDYDF